MSSLVTKIGKQVNQMTKSQKKVANYLLFNMDKLLFFTADELAKAANVSTATVVRFARELDFEGYTDMQKAARSASTTGKRSRRTCPSPARKRTVPSICWRSPSAKTFKT